MNILSSLSVTIKKNYPIFDIDIFCQAFVCGELSPCNAKKLLFVELRYCGFSLQLEQTSNCSLSSSGKQIPQFGVWIHSPNIHKACYSSVRDPQPSHTLTDFPFVKILSQKAFEK